MRKSHSAPGLGKGPNPLVSYRAHTLFEITPGEVEAEMLYYAAISASLCKSAFAILAKDLARRSEDGGAYLTYLICRGHDWPTVSRRLE